MLPTRTPFGFTQAPIDVAWHANQCNMDASRYNTGANRNNTAASRNNTGASKFYMHAGLNYVPANRENVDGAAFLAAGDKN
jgi:hypothetical protein